MHIHQSIVDAKTGENIFSDARRQGLGRCSNRIIAGLQKYLPAGDVAVRAERQQLPPHHARRLGADQRAMGPRQPHRRASACRSRTPQTRRIENRLGGADANPYLAIAASLACGYLGMIEGLKPTGPDHRLGLRPAVLTAA